MRVLLRKSWFWFIVFLCAAELIARAFSPFSLAAVMQTPHILQRNQYFRRAWPEYVRGLADAAQGYRRMIVLGNSQIFGREVLPDTTYPGLLENLLNAAPQPGDLPWRVENWGAPGGFGHSLTLLAAKALAQQPDVLLIVSLSNNFSTVNCDSPLTYSAFDTPLLAAESEVLAQLPWSFLTRHVTLEMWLSLCAKRYSGLVRMSDHLWEAAMRHCDWDFPKIRGVGHAGKETYWFKPPVQGYDAPSPASRRRDAGLPPFGLARQRGGAGAYIPNPADPEQVISKAEPVWTAYLQDFAAILQDRGATRVVFVLMPLCTELLVEESLPNLERSALEFRRLLPVPVWDMTHELDPVHFYTFSHFDPTNHRALAALLQRTMEREGLLR